MRAEKTSESKPSTNCRNGIVENKTGDGGLPGMSVGGVLESGLHVLRLVGGVISAQALARNVRTCRLDVKVMMQVGLPGEDRADARHRGRVVRSRVEGAVMAPDRRDGDIQLDPRANR